MKRMWKTAVSGLLCLVLCLGMIPAQVSAAEMEVWNGVTISEPQLAEGEEYYEISNGAELAYIAQMGGEWLTYDYRLTDDIYLNEVLPEWDAEGNCTNAEELNLWTPIGNEDEPFTGHLQGGGHEIVGMYVSETEMDYAGLFGVLEEEASVGYLCIRDSYGANLHDSAAILVGHVSGNGKNGCYITGVWILDCCVKAGYGAGGLSAWAGNVEVDNCFVDAEVYSGNYAGGCFGDACGTFKNCYATGKVHGDDHVGGFAGWQEVSTTSFTNCYSACAVTADDDWKIGGFIGNNTYDVDVTNCFFLQTDTINQGYEESEYYGYAVDENGELVTAGALFDDRNMQEVLNELPLGNTGYYIWLRDSSGIHLSDTMALTRRDGYTPISQYSDMDAHDPTAAAVYNEDGKMLAYGEMVEQFIDLKYAEGQNVTYKIFSMDEENRPLGEAKTF